MGFGKKPEPDPLLTALTAAFNDTVDSIDTINKEMRGAEEVLKRNRDILRSQINGEDKSALQTVQGDNSARKIDERSSRPSVLQKLRLYKEKSAKQQSRNKNPNKTRINRPEL